MGSRIGTGFRLGRTGHERMIARRRRSAGLSVPRGAGLISSRGGFHFQTRSLRIARDSSGVPLFQVENGQSIGSVSTSSQSITPRRTHRNDGTKRFKRVYRGREQRASHLVTVYDKVTAKEDDSGAIRPRVIRRWPKRCSKPIPTT
jgi:hypothetical protein